MTIIGEKINGAIPSVAQAIASRDEGFIRRLARRQAEAGAEYLDVCAGTRPDLEYDALAWLIGIVQDETEVPLCVDSPDARMIERVMPLVKDQRGILNSVSLEGDKCDVLFPLMKGTEWKAVALTCDGGGVSTTVERKVEIANALVEKAAAFGIGPERLFIDPMVMALSAVNDSMLSFMDALRKIKAAHPTVRTTSGLSNISFGMPYRKAVNIGFLTLALYAGMDSAIIDPTNAETYAAILAAEALVGKDRFMRNYNKAYRAGRIGPKKAEAK